MSQLGSTPITCTIISLVAISEKEISEALLHIAEQFNIIDQRLAKLTVSVIALKGTVAKQMSPDDPEALLARIESLEKLLTERDPTAAARQEFSDVIEAVKLLEKHGGPKQA